MMFTQIKVKGSLFGSLRLVDVAVADGKVGEG
jgi:hypothetical protein